MEDHAHTLKDLGILLLFFFFFKFIRLPGVLPRGHFASSVLGHYVLLSKCRTRGVRLKLWAKTLSSSLLTEIFEVLVVGHRRAVGRIL